MTNKTSECKGCGRKYRTLTEEELCYACHVYKYDEPPKTGAYKQDKDKK